MDTPRQWLFPPFRLEPDNACLWRDGQHVPLKPKSFAVLHHLVMHAGRLVTQDALFAAVWPEAAVGDAVLKVCIAELRKALGETAKAPRFIATVHRRGYRFIAPVTPADLPDGNLPRLDLTDTCRSTPQLPSQRGIPLVSREATLHALQVAWAYACRGARQVFFVTGEPGIGKTAVVEAFTAQMAADPQACIARGQCVEHYGTEEAYLPILEVLGELCRGPVAAQVVAQLRQHAPTWLVQLPWLLTAADRERLTHELVGGTRERMRRELGELVDALTAKVPVLLVLEDLHWSDYATVDAVTMLARRRTSARLMVLGTYRPAAVIFPAHPLQAVTHDLQRHASYQEWPLARLRKKDIAAYLQLRFPHHCFPAALVPWLHRHTDGNPLFLVTITDMLVTRGVLSRHAAGWTLEGEIETLELDVPDTLRRMLAHQLDRLPPELQRLLEAASVVGVTFSMAAVAAGLEEDLVRLEAQADDLVRLQQLVPAGVVAWPDGTAAAGYAFTHALCQQVAYEQVGAGRQGHLHRRIGARLEAAYGPHTGDIAAELAEHFVRGRDIPRAVRYLQRAAEKAADRFAHHEVVTVLTRALELLQTLPETPKRQRHELEVYLALGPAVIATKGQDASTVKQHYTRAVELYQAVGDPPQLFTALWNLRLLYLLRGELQMAGELGEQLLHVAQGAQDPTLLMAAHESIGTTLLELGDLIPAQDHLQRGVTLSDGLAHRGHTSRFAQAPGMVCLSCVALNLWLLGYPDQAQHRIHEALRLAQEVGQPSSLVSALFYAALLDQFRREVRSVHKRSETLLAFSSEQGFAQGIASGTVLRGWALVLQGQGEEAFRQMRRGLAAYRETGAEWAPLHHLALLADASHRLGRASEGLSLLSEALAAGTNRGERYYEAEIHRLKGELLMQAARVSCPGDIRATLGMITAGADRRAPAEAEGCFYQALAIARRQQAKSLELRAAMSLSRLWQSWGKHAEARQLLAGVYKWFTEGFDTADLREANTLLEELC